MFEPTEPNVSPSALRLIKNQKQLSIKSGMPTKIFSGNHLRLGRLSPDLPNVGREMLLSSALERSSRTWTLRRISLCRYGFITSESLLASLSRFVLRGLVAGHVPAVYALDPRDFAVLVSVQVQARPNRPPVAELSAATSYTVSRKLLTDNSWTPLATLAANSSGYSDSAVVSGAGYEYEIARSSLTASTLTATSTPGLNCPCPATVGVSSCRR